MKNEPAFPLLDYDHESSRGIFRIEYFAAAALASMSDDERGESAVKIAGWAFEIAEAMCAEAEKRRKAK